MHIFFILLFLLLIFAILATTFQSLNADFIIKFNKFF